MSLVICLKTGRQQARMRPPGKTRRRTVALHMDSISITWTDSMRKTITTRTLRTRFARANTTIITTRRQRLTTHCRPRRSLCTSAATAAAIRSYASFVFMKRTSNSPIIGSGNGTGQRSSTPPAASLKPASCCISGMVESPARLDAHRTSSTSFI